jgi:hypothetical protein
MQSMPSSLLPDDTIDCARGEGLGTASSCAAMHRAARCASFVPNVN